MPKKVSLPTKIEESVWASMIPTVYRFAKEAAKGEDAEPRQLSHVRMVINLYARSAINGPRAQLTSFKQVLKELAERKTPPDLEAQFLHQIMQDVSLSHRPTDTRIVGDDRPMVEGYWQVNPVVAYEIDQGGRPPIGFGKLLHRRERERFYAGMKNMVVKTILKGGWRMESDPTCAYFERDTLVEMLNEIGSMDDADEMLKFIMDPDKIHPDLPVVFNAKKYDGTRLIYVSEYFIKDMQLD